MADLITDWLKAREEWAAANAAGRPVKERNRIMDRIWALGHEIARSPALHQRINELCESREDPDTRLGAALVREHWDARGAADTMVSVIHASGASVTRPVTMDVALSIKTSTTASTAALCLLNIDSGRGNTGTSR